MVIIYIYRRYICVLLGECHDCDLSMGISLYRLLLFEMGHPGTPTKISSNKPARFPVPERAFLGVETLPALLHRCSGSESACVASRRTRPGDFCAPESGK